MDPNIISIIIGAGALIVGIIAGKLLFAKNTRKKIEEAELQSNSILREAELRAETIRKEKELEAKEKFVQMKAAHDREVNDRNRKINESENRIRQKEQSINQKEGGLDKQIKENDAIKEHLNRQIEL
ncbi:MAG TPA: Rnase Y domain-containing protein, partial [Chitinophagaceae bacterium]|nr:Rnase Y domain-containing protein [Chitinophagaceae bacterium]